MYALVKNGEVIRDELPTCGLLNNGRTVSNYYLLPENMLIAEGWLPLVGEKPIYNPEIEYLKPTYVIEYDKVLVTYEVLTSQ